MATGEPQNSHQDFYNVLGITKGASMREICKAYKSLVMKWHPDKHPTNRSEAEKKFVAITEAYRVLNNMHTEYIHKDEESKTGDSKRSKDDNFFIRRPSFLSRNKSRSQTPTPSSRSPRMSEDNKSTTSSSTNVYSFNSHLSISNPTFVDSTLLNGRKSSLETKNPASLSRSASRLPGNTPILFSQSTVRRKPPPIERKLECTLEELCNGGLKKIKLTRNVITSNGIVQEEELLKIRIKPGWKKGTKITFEGKGDEKPGFLPADIMFLIDEKRHSLFKRIGDDLEIGVEISLVQALTGCSILIPLLGGEKTNLLVDNIIYPGYEEIISGQGMPKPKEGDRGNLKIRFLIDFPIELADEQRLEAYEILKECC